MTRTQLITLIAAQFMVEHNQRRPNDSAGALLERSLTAAEELVIAAEQKYQGRGEQEHAP